MTALLSDAVLAGSRRALARLITQVENDDPAARAALAALYPHTGQAHIVGVTGAPGTGKSTLVNELAKRLRRAADGQAGGTVAIVAVDPTSPFTGGAILGDRIRMRDLAGDPGVFIRSMATRGSLGGLARATGEVVDVLDAAGFAVVFVETVGAGQSEVDIARTAHTTVVVEAPGFGDEVQAIKAGILEIADVLVVNKSDLPGADATRRTLEAMLELGEARPRRIRHHGEWLAERAAPGETAGPEDATSPDGRWRPPVLAAVAQSGDGVDAVLAAIGAHRAYLQSSGELARREHARIAAQLDQLLQERLRQRLLARVPDGALAALVARVRARERSPRAAVDELLAGLDAAGAAAGPQSA